MSLLFGKHLSHDQAVPMKKPLSPLTALIALFLAIQSSHMMFEIIIN